MPEKGEPERAAPARNPEGGTMISITRLFRLSMKMARWCKPHVREWHRKRHLHRMESQRHLDARNWSEAEKHLVIALAERRHSSQRRCELLLNLERA